MEQIDILNIDGTSYEIVDGISKAQNQQAQQTLDTVTQTTNTTVKTLLDNTGMNYDTAFTMQSQVENAQSYNIYTVAQAIDMLDKDALRLEDIKSDANSIIQWLGSFY